MSDPLASSIEERADAELNGDGDPQQALFALEGDKPLTLAGLGRRGVPIESEVSIMSASVPVRGLIDPDKPGRLVISYEPQKYEYVPVRDRGNATITGWKLRQHLRVTYIEPVIEVEAEDAE